MSGNIHIKVNEGNGRISIGNKIKNGKEWGSVYIKEEMIHCRYSIEEFSNDGYSGFVCTPIEK